MLCVISFYDYICLQDKVLQPQMDVALFIYLIKCDTSMMFRWNAGKTYYCIDMSVLLEIIPLVKFIKTTSGIRVVYFP